MARLRQHLNNISAFGGLEPVVFATSQVSLDRAYSRPALSGSMYRRVLENPEVPLDMIPHEFEQLRQRQDTRFGGKFWRPAGSRRQAASARTTHFTPDTVPPLAGD